MKLHIVAVGRARKTPEADMVSDYLTRFDRTGRALHLGPARVIEIDERKAQSRDAQAIALDAACPEGTVRIALDERGDTYTSPAFARHLAELRDQGTRDLAFLIGGADGLTPDCAAQATFRLSLGKMVWPHMLARVMLAEQIYRAATILAGGPYHRA